MKESISEITEASLASCELFPRSIRRRRNKLRTCWPPSWTAMHLVTFNRCSMPSKTPQTGIEIAISARSVAPTLCVTCREVFVGVGWGVLPLREMADPLIMYGNSCWGWFYPPPPDTPFLYVTYLGRISLYIRTKPTFFSHILLIFLHPFFKFTFSCFIYVHCRFVRCNYCIGDQLIEPYGFFGSLPLFYHYVIIVLFILLRRINWWWWGSIVILMNIHPQQTLLTYVDTHRRTLNCRSSITFYAASTYVIIRYV